MRHGRNWKKPPGSQTITPFTDIMLNKLLGIAENASEHGLMMDHMLEVVHWFMLALFVGWSAFFLFTIHRFHRSRHPVADYHGVKSRTGTHLEVGVVIVEAILLLGLAFPLWSQRANAFPVDADAVKVRVIAEQFAFNIHYPGADGAFGKQSPDLVSASNPIGLDPADPSAKDDIVTRNDLHLPINRPAILNISSKDVIHNFGLYTMRTAQDPIPGTEVPLWFTPNKTGEWEVICGQLCGLGHYSMKALLTVVPAEEYDAWLAQMSPAPKP